MSDNVPHPASGVNHQPDCAECDLPLDDQAGAHMRPDGLLTHPDCCPHCIAADVEHARGIR